MTDDVKKGFNDIKQHMDFSDYPPEHPCFDKTKRKVLGMFKDEVNGKIITKFIGLKPKSYAFTIHGEDDEHKKSKGVVKHKVKKNCRIRTTTKHYFKEKSTKSQIILSGVSHIKYIQCLKLSKV